MDIQWWYQQRNFLLSLVLHALVVWLLLLPTPPLPPTPANAAVQNWLTVAFVDSDPMLTADISLAPASIQRPESTEVVEPEVIEPEVIEPEVIEPEVIEPEAIKPEVIEPEAIEPEAIKPEIVEPEAIKPEIIEPEAIKPEIVEPEAIEPEVIEPEAIKPEIVEPEAIEPEVIEPEVIEPEVIEPEVIEPEAIKPEIIEPEAIKPEVIEPEAIKPEIIEPEAIKPEIIEPEAIKPEIVEPEVIEPEIIEPEAIKPEIIEPEAIKPEIIEPEAIEPEVIEPKQEITWSSDREAALALFEKSDSLRRLQPTPPEPAQPPAVGSQEEDFADLSYGDRIAQILQIKWRESSPFIPPTGRCRVAININPGGYSRFLEVIDRDCDFPRNYHPELRAAIEKANPLPVPPEAFIGRVVICFGCGGSR